MGGQIAVTWLGHSTVVIGLDGVRVLTDPLLRAHAGLLRRLGTTPDPAQWRRPDAVLVSHLHHDHAELRSLRMLGETPILSAPRNVAWMRRQNLTFATALGDDWMPLAREVEVRQVRADHHSRPMPHRPNDAHGHLVRGPSGRVWVAGDTGLHPEMAALPDLAGGPLDLALVPVWGWGPRLSPGHLTPDQAAIAVARTGARFAIPVHWGTLHPPFALRFARDWLDLPGRHFAEALARHAPDCEPVVLEPGEGCVIPAAAGEG
jgi:L-ascorbate metabolism protein UlaG (beta-lactamase superfamily)